MPPTPAAKPDRRPPLDPDREFRGPPEEEFWERYNRRLEFPLSAVAAVLLHVAVAAFVIFLFVKVMGAGPDRSAVPVSLVDLGGDDDIGLGSKGSGGTTDDIKEGENQFKAQKNELPTPEQLAQAEVAMKRVLLDDAGTLPVAAANRAAFAKSDEELLKKILGSRKGDGPGDGKGNTGEAGKGPGGSGADSTRARSLRWVLRFQTSDGHDYVNQLAAMGATILVPLPPENKQCLHFSDLRTPNPRMATDDDLKSLSGQIKFSDTRPGSVAGVCAVLRVTQPAQSFWAFFPRGLEDDLSRKELAYRNRRAEDIEETIFKVIVRGGSYDLVVVDQTPKR
ncbi:hypothetical protein [Urbifossiella limnaea]|uniref:Uncharacterized protein n=1 Tax=Urbifossiella limnaea TaxID=2528023 RepID=A0A517XTA5_9BACT|nr:hypothetical protein [Urbifossiella limnaea]QDU20723.1 hypothetical protein ETAA1_26810 [Urbifossiella limnaea]